MGLPDLTTGVEAAFTAVLLFGLLTRSPSPRSSSSSASSPLLEPEITDSVSELESAFQESKDATEVTLLSAAGAPIGSVAEGSKDASVESSNESSRSAAEDTEEADSSDSESA